MRFALAVFDFDGVFSDGRFLFGESGGAPSKIYNARDSLALKMLQSAGVRTAILTNDHTNLDLANADHVRPRLDFLASGGGRPKLDVVRDWATTLGIGLDAVAYMGDDLADLPVLERVGLSGCPRDAVAAVRQTCTYVADADGGGGAVRLFAERVLELNEQREPVTAIITVRKGSVRCPLKNARPLGDPTCATSLLERKIRVLQQVPEIDAILVTSDCDDMLATAKRLGAKVHRRDSLYCTPPSASYLHRHLADISPTGTFMFANCTTPFVEPYQFSDAIEAWRNKPDAVDSVASVLKTKEFLWDGPKPLNYNPSAMPNSQDLPNWTSLTFAFCIIARTTARSYGNVVGRNPQWIPCEGVEGVDVDEPHEFLAASAFEAMGVRDNTDVAELLQPRPPPKLLDCTLRDGGYTNDWRFTDEQVRAAYLGAAEAGAAYCEVGFRGCPSADGGLGEWATTSDVSVRRVLDDVRTPSCRLAVMVRAASAKLAWFSNADESPIDMVRVLLARPSLATPKDAEHAAHLAKHLVAMGYTVAVNVPYAHEATASRLRAMLDPILEVTRVEAVWLADTLGCIAPGMVPQLMTEMRRVARCRCMPIGFHAHNSLGDALAKTQRAVQCGAAWIDTCLGGLGRGGGNLPLIAAALTLYEQPSLAQLTSAVAFELAHVPDGPNPYYAMAAHARVHPNVVRNALARDGATPGSVVAAIACAAESTST